MIDFDKWREENDIKIFDVFVILVDFVLEDVSKFYESQKVIVFLWDLHVECEDLLDRVVVGLLDREVLSIDDEPESIQPLFKSLLAKLKNTTSEHIDCSCGHASPQLQDKQNESLVDKKIGIKWVEICLEVNQIMILNWYDLDLKIQSFVLLDLLRVVLLVLMV